MSEIKAGDAVRYLDDDSTLTKGGLYKVSAVKDNMNVGYPQMVFLEGLGGDDFWFDYRFEVVPTFPDSFSFTHETTSQMYDMTKNEHGKWACSPRGTAADKYHATYTAEEITEYFAKGYWKEVSFSEPIKVADHPVEEILEVRVNGVVQEPEMCFPITYKHSGNSEEHIVVKDCYGALYWMEDFPEVWKNLFTEEELRENIKSGEMIVTSVGPQTAPETPTSDSYKLPKPTRPAPPMPAVKPPKASDEVVDTLKEILAELQGIRKGLTAQTEYTVGQDPSWADLSFPLSIDGFQTKHNY